jgi:hypothetical protein
MKPISVVALLSLFIFSCSSYSVKKEVDSRASIKDAKRLGVIIRVPQKSRVNRDEILTSLSRVMNGYQLTTELVIIPDLTPQVIEFTDNEDRFYQPSSDSDYLKYKSIGILRTYLRTNSDEIKKAMDKNSLDGVIIYEVYGVVSVEMQLLRFDSVVAIADKALEMVYLDHQDNTLDSKQYDFNSLRSEMLNHISTRFMGQMKSLGYVKDLK